jgi:hypothetical protein
MSFGAAWTAAWRSLERSSLGIEFRKFFDVFNPWLIGKTGISFSSGICVFSCLTVNIINCYLFNKTIKMSSAPPLTIYILPVSGVSFPAQLGILAALSSGRRIAGQPPTSAVPDVAIASSGGNIAAYYALSADWNKERIYSGVGMIHNESFLTGWADYMPSWLFVPFSQAVFRRGYGFASLFRRVFAPGQAREGTEIWTGAVCHSKREHRVFTNKAMGQTILTPRVAVVDQLPNLGDSLQPIYLDGDIRAISEITQGSASIPWIVRPVTFRNDQYSDGGGVFASPLSAFEANIRQLGQENKNRLRLFYISPINVDKAPRPLFGILKELSDLLHGSKANDMRTFINLLGALGADALTPEQLILPTPEDVAKMLTHLENNYSHFGVILYPQEDEPMIKLATKFHYIEIQTAMAIAEKSLRAYVWKVL